jgi:CubicO group peptidase (beta-lactamase class C family)/D-alanyl-D-alanine dipeptidase
MNRTYSYFGRPLLGLVLGLFLVLTSRADEDAFTELGEAIAVEAKNKNLPMLSIVLVDEGGVVWSFGVGTSATNPKLAADGDTTYRIGSVSKLFTDIVVMQMVDREILDLDAPVTHYLPEFAPDNPFDEPITLRSLMSHSSGLVREPPAGNYFDPGAQSLADTVLSLNETELVYAPGSKVQYSNAGIAVVGRVVEKVSGKAFAELLDDNVLQPLGMTHSAFAPTATVMSKLPEAYMWSYQGDRTVAPQFELGMSPAGSMYSTMNDLALFMDALIKKGEGQNGRILNEATLDEMWTPQSTIRSGRDRSFGIGFSLSEFDGELAVSHGGAIYGFATQLKVLPGSKAGVAVSANLDMANGTINRIADHALSVLTAIKKGEPVPEFHVSKAIDDSRAQAIAGFYKNASGTIEITRRFGDLYVERIEGLSLRLREIDGRIVVDDIMRFSDDIEFQDGKVRIFGAQYVPTTIAKPPSVPAAWSGLIGEYGFDHNILYISEKFGQLHALIEWGTEYPLEDLGDNRFRFPPYGLYPNEQLVFEKDSAGRVSNASLNGIDFLRRSVGNIAGNVFRITPVESVSVLEQKALLATPPTEAGEFLDADLVDIADYSDTIRLDIRYASDDNFLGVPVYSSARAFLQRPAAEAIGRISRKLEEQGFGLLVHDAYRPWYVTKIFWDATPEESKRFVADPSQGSRHNRGCAIDLTLYDLESGRPVEMVGLYDEMSPRSYPHYPGGGSLQRWHRDLLREAMEAEGFDVYEYEWWHFDFHGWEKYRILTDTFEALD